MERRPSKQVPPTKTNQSKISKNKYVVKVLGPVKKQDSCFYFNEMRVLLSLYTETYLSVKNIIF